MNLAENAFAHWEYEEEKERQADVVLAREYYEGEQRTYLTPRLREFLNLDKTSKDSDFNLNIVRGVVEALTEKLIVGGFKCNDEASAAWAWSVWQGDRVDSKQNNVHEAACRDGESFVIVDYDQALGELTFIPHERYTDATCDGDNEGCKATYRNDDDSQPLECVSKRWIETQGNGRARQRLTVYYPDRIEKYAIIEGQWTPIDVETMIAEGDTAWPVPWLDNLGQPLGIPVAHFKNPGLRPEVADGIPMQNAINKTLVDLLGAADLTAFRIFVAFGFNPTTDGQPPSSDGSNLMGIAPGQIIGSSGAANDKSFEAVEGSDPTPLLNMIQQLIHFLAIATRTPASRFNFTGAVASAETLKQQDQSLLSKVALRQMLFGDAWEDAMTIARRLQNKFGGGFEGALLDESMEFQTVWQDTAPRDRNVELQGTRFKL